MLRADKVDGIRTGDLKQTGDLKTNSREKLEIKDKLTEMKNGFDRLNSILDIVEEMTLGYTETFKNHKGNKVWGMGDGKSLECPRTVIQTQKV